MNITSWLNFSLSQLYRRFKVYKCIDWENTLERTYSDWLESNVHFSRKPGHPGYEQDDSDDE